jgi:hypothetical protein
MGSTNIISGMRCRTIRYAISCLAIATTIAWPAFAQDSFDTVIEVRGKLKDFRRNILTVTRDDGVDVAVMLHEDPTKLVFAAEAKPQWLKPGMLVRIESMFGPGGQPVAPIDSVELIQPIQAARTVQVQQDMYAPGIYPLDRKPNNGQAQGFEPGKYRIIGSIVGTGAAGIMVNANQTQVPIPISPDAKWLIRFNNLALAEPGDLVHVTGFHKPPNETEVKAGSVRVVVERIYGDAVENPKAKKKTRVKPEAKPEAPAAAEPAKAEP